MFNSDHQEMKINKLILLIVPILVLSSARLFAQAAAEVPSEVAIPQPSEAEVVIAEEALSKFKMESNDQMAAIFEAYPALLEVRPPRMNTAIIPRLSRQFYQKHENNLQVASAGNIDLLFMGDSITDFWRNETGAYAGKPIQDKYFSQWNVANFGIAGDTTQGVLHRLQNGEGEGFNPKAIMLMIGTNNTFNNTAAEIAEGVGAIVLALEKHFPQSKILLLAVFPRGAHNEPLRKIITDINSIIKNLGERNNVSFLDIGDIFFDENGDIPVSVMSDGLHPGPEGYERWAKAVIGPITELMSK